MADDNYYKLLGINSDAETVVITAAYKALAKKYHPDVYPDKAKGEEKLKLLNNAYETLSDPDKRKRYDASFSSGYDHEEPKPEADKPFRETEANRQAPRWQMRGVGGLVHWITVFFAVLIISLTGSSGESDFILVVAFLPMFLLIFVLWVTKRRWIWFPWQHDKE